MSTSANSIKISGGDLSLVSSILTYLKSKAKNKKIRILNGTVYFKKAYVTVSMFLENEEIEGSGCSDNKNDAALKAVMELFERYIFLTKKVDVFKQVNNHESQKTLRDIYLGCAEAFVSIITSTTNGMASHTNPSSSLKSAINEAIERHVLLKSMALNIKPKLINMEVIPQSMTEPIFVKTYLWKGPLNKNIIAIKANFGSASCYGFGCSDNLSNAIDKAKCEIAPRIEVLRKNKIYTHLKLRDNEHFDYHLQRLSPWANDFFDTGLIVDVPEIDINLSYEDFWFCDYSMPEDFKVEGISVVRAVSPKVQPLFKGAWGIKKINVGAFEERSLLDLPRELHVVG